MTHRWRVRTRLPERFGHRCRVLAVGGMNSVLVEFEDGYRVLSSRNYLRRITSRQALASTRRVPMKPAEQTREGVHVLGAESYDKVLVEIVEVHARRLGQDSEALIGEPCPHDPAVGRARIAILLELQSLLR